MLTALRGLLCSKQCWHNVLVPNTHETASLTHQLNYADKGITGIAFKFLTETEWREYGISNVNLLLHFQQKVSEVEYRVYFFYVSHQCLCRYRLMRLPTWTHLVAKLAVVPVNFQVRRLYIHIIESSHTNVAVTGRKRTLV